MKIALGCDHAGYRLKEAVKKHLMENNQLKVYDFGTFSESSIDYPDIAFVVADSVSRGDNSLGIIICGTGAGVAITANKIHGIRAAACSDTFSARAVREHNDANVITMGSRIVGEGVAMDIVDAFLGATFAGGRHQKRVDKISLYEKKYECSGD